MKPGIAILAALPREIEPLVRDWPVRVASRKDGSIIWQCEQAVAVCAGMGTDRAQHAFDLALRQMPIREIISVGYAGALASSAAKNSIHWPAAVIDAQTGERFECESGHGILVTADHIVGQAEKLQLAERWNADLVDMEASAVARCAAQRGLAFRAAKVISDESGEALPDLSRFIDARGTFREAAFAAHLVLHPWLIPGTIHLARRSGQASKALAAALREFLRSTE